jgi:putative DNA primase/helicase
VTAVETEDGRWWAEAKIKSLTGGDKITARFMRQNFFEFTPQFKLVIAGNHRPGLRNVDEAIRRRLHLVPFTVTIPESERDSRLLEKLKAEYSGILAWAVEGCIAWQREGLNPPAVVRNATAEYLAAEDAIGRWLDDCCVIRPACWTAGAALFGSYLEWCERAGERPRSQKLLTQALEARGFSQDRARIGGKQGRGFAGIGLLCDTCDTSLHIEGSRAHARIPPETGTSVTSVTAPGMEN